MKRIFALVLCAILMVGLFAFVASAEETPVVDETPIVETAPVEEPTITETIVDYVKENGEEILVVVFMSLMSVYEARKRNSLNGAIGTLNSNAINVATNSAIAVNETKEEVKALVNEVTQYRSLIETLLGEFRAEAEENEQLKGALTKVEHFLETSKLANKELADEVAELLVLANIPNSVKDELYARHTAAVKAMSDAENTEVIHNDGEEA